ncbi:helix-turn-helix domain-containing protein [Lentilitoribacter sp. Alg239-R112]|uniref:helix-turn-helix transcriptional regulator n=1 Tax=Lentilitoribacter sp. Alg239-R112 TaxID=2305987 RepID=UPI0013A70311|nr:helix-turn-helix domain-containing protein [Lentilitoribacter sp. Alg239-R112]
MPKLLATFDDLDDSCLIIPEGLDNFADAKAVMKYGKSAIYHKLINSEALDVEFHVNLPCLCFILQGQETFITPNGTEIVVNANEMVLFSRDVHMVSNFYNRSGQLEAFLFFFDQDIISKFKRRISSSECQTEAKANSYKISANENLSEFMHSLLKIYNNSSGSADLLDIKLMELLHLVKLADNTGYFESFLNENNAESGRRNIQHIMRRHFTHNLKVQDYARLSGRSVSTFNREFKRQFNIAPSQWLIDKRLSEAHNLLLKTQMQVTEIALEVGYDNTSHFISKFKQKYGQTPKRVQASNL